MAAAAEAVWWLGRETMGAEGGTHSLSLQHEPQKQTANWFVKVCGLCSKPSRTTYFLICAHLNVPCNFHPCWMGLTFLHVWNPCTSHGFHCNWFYNDRSWCMGGGALHGGEQRHAHTPCRRNLDCISNVFWGEMYELYTEAHLIQWKNHFQKSAL